MPRQANGRWDISRLWAMLGVIASVAAATIFVLAQVHKISEGQVSQHAKTTLDIAHPRLDKRLDRIEQKLTQLSAAVRGDRCESREGP